MKIGLLSLAGVLALAWVSPALAEDLEFLLINESSEAVVGFYVSDEGSNSWEENLLDGGILDVDIEVSVIIEDGLIHPIHEVAALRTDWKDRRGGILRRKESSNLMYGMY